MAEKIDMGMDRSDSRIHVTPKTSHPKSSKLIANTAHGASMTVPGGNKPDGWATLRGSKGMGTPGGPMMAEEYGKGSGQMQKHPTPSFSIPRTKPKVL